MAFRSCGTLPRNPDIIPDQVVEPSMTFGAKQNCVPKPSAVMKSSEELTTLQLTLRPSEII